MKIGKSATEYFEAGDPWDFEESEHEQKKYGLQLSMLDERRYHRALEIGCANGCFTRLLTRLVDSLVAIDVAPTAITEARAALPSGNVDFRVANVMDYEPREDGPWDLVVLSETICCLGWFYSFVDVAWLGHKLF